LFILGLQTPLTLLMIAVEQYSACSGGELDTIILVLEEEMLMLLTIMAKSRCRMRIIRRMKLLCYLKRISSRRIMVAAITPKLSSNYLRETAAIS